MLIALSRVRPAPSSNSFSPVFIGEFAVLCEDLKLSGKLLYGFIRRLTDTIRLWTHVLLKSIVVGLQLLFVVLCEVLCWRYLFLPDLSRLKDSFISLLLSVILEDPKTLIQCVVWNASNFLEDCRQSIAFSVRQRCWVPYLNSWYHVMTLSGLLNWFYSDN